MKRFVLSLDAGTTSNRAIVFDRSGSVVSVAQKEFRQRFPRPGWVEHDAEEIWRTQLAVAREALGKAAATADDIAAIGIANQRETTVVWNRSTGRPVAPAIVWQCRRTSEYCDELKRRGLSDEIRKRTGLVADAYFSGTKIRWILDNTPGARAAAERGELLFGTVESWLVWKLTGGKRHVTDRSNASRTMIFNINTLDWDGEILSELGIPRQMLPEVRPSSEIYGFTDLFGTGIPVAGAAGDQQAALFGQCCFNPGEAKNTYGTGCFMLMATGREPKFSKNGLLTTVAWGLGDETVYALEGSVFVAGAAIQWLRDELGLVSSAAESETLARSVASSNGCHVVPAFTGLGAPYWDQYARGAILGLTRGVNRAHIVRATLESLAYQSCDVLSAMQADAGVPLASLRVDGGASANDFLMQFQSDISGSPVERPECIETTAFGAALLAGLAVGFWQSPEEALGIRRVERVFEPSLAAAEREALLASWHEAVDRVRSRRF